MIFGSAVADLRDAVRAMRSSPIYAISSIATLGVGIAAATTIFCVLQAVLLQSLPYASADRLVTLWESSEAYRLPKVGVTPPHLNDWRRQSRTFADFAASRQARFILSDETEVPERVIGMRVSSNYFQMLGVPIDQGRGLTAVDSANPAVAVVSHGLWIRRFGKDPMIVGRQIHIDGNPVTVVGVTASSWNLMAQIWTPLRIPPDVLADRQAHMLNVVGRLRPQISVTTAGAEMNDIARRLTKTYAEDRGWSILAIPILDQTVGAVRPALMTLALAVGLLLLISCVNVWGLALTRGRGRAREIAIRGALGASRARIIGRLASESTLFLMIALVLSSGLTTIALAVLRRTAPPSIPRISDLHVGWPVFLFATAAATLSLAIAAILPAVQVARPDLIGHLKDRSGGGESRHRAREIVLVAQIGFAVVLLSVSAVLIKRFVALRAFDLGVRADGIVVAQVSLPRVRYGQPQSQADYARNVLGRVAAMPGVAFASATTSMPGSPTGTPIYLFGIRGHPEADPTKQPASYFVTVSPDYFQTFGIPVIQGRTFTLQDRENAAAVAIVDQALARRYFAGRDPLGERVFAAGDSVPREIVGVVGSVRQAGASSEDHPVLYTPLAQMPSGDLTVAIRTDRSPGIAARDLPAAIRSVDPLVPVLDVGPYQNRVAAFIAPDSFYAGIALGFSTIALLLCAIGLYGVVAYDVARQRREIGIRMALGASTGRVRGTVVLSAMRLAFVGLLVGSAVALVAQNFMRHLFGGGSVDVVGLAVACVALLTTALCAALIPAVRASATDPLAAIRAES